MAKLTDFFDVSVKDQLEITFKSLSSDKFFIFSGPPKFNLIADDNRPLCPILFTQSVNIQESQGGGARLPVIGSSTIIDLPSTQGTGAIQIGASAIVTGTPKVLLNTGESDTTIDTTEKWDFIKRLYYDAITFTPATGSKKLIEYFLPTDGADAKKSSMGFTTIGKTVKDIFTNFGKSEFYQIPFGMLVIMMTKSNDHVTTRYYENCKLQQKAGTFIAQAGQLAGLHPGAFITFPDQVPLELTDISSLSGTTTDTDFMNVLMEYIGEK